MGNDRRHTALSDERRRPIISGFPGAPPWWLVVAATAVLTAVTVQVVGHGPLTDLDRDIARHVVDLDIHGATRALIYPLTLFGMRGAVLAVTIPLFGYFAWRQRSTEPVIRYLLALVLLAVVVYAFKASIERTAPSYTPGKPNPAQSFPSGHIANAIVIWGLAAFASIRAGAPMMLRRVVRIVQIVAVPAVFIAMTLLNYHWFSDFLAGACIGVMLLPIVVHPALTRIGASLDAWSRRYMSAWSR